MGVGEHRLEVVILVALLLFSGVAMAEVTRCSDDVTAEVGRFWTLSPGSLWYSTTMEGGDLVKYINGKRIVYLYTGPGAPEPTGKNVRYRVLFQPFRPTSSEAACRKAMQSFEGLMADDGLIRGELQINEQAHACWLVPDDNRTVYVVPMQYGAAVIAVIVEVTRPDMKFPKAALALIETLHGDPVKGSPPK